VTQEPVWTTWIEFYQDSNCNPSVFQPVASHYADCISLLLIIIIIIIIIIVIVIVTASVV
jgi:hypothetical protein